MVIDQICTCDGCTQIQQLTLKFVAHAGEVAVHKVRRYTELAGVDVILVHRLLKNTVQAPEYVLFSEELYRNGGNAFNPMQEVDQDLEGIGRVRTYFAEIAGVAGPLPPIPEPSWPGRLARTLDVAGRGVPYMLGLRRPRRVAPES